MIVLGIETATRIGSVGIVEIAPLSIGEPGASPAYGGARVRAEVTLDAGLQHGAALLPAVDAALERGGLDLDACDAIAVSVGPGSFTGLRVGLATAKGLVAGSATALVGVSTLEALALVVAGRDGSQAGESDAVEKGTARETAVVCSCLDARRGEVYGAAFAVDSSAGLLDPRAIERLLPDAAYAPGEFADALAALLATSRVRGAAPQVWLLGDGAERYADAMRGRLPAGMRSSPVAERPPSGAAVAMLGAREIARRGADDPRALAPTYVRASQAERARAERAREPERRGSVAER